MSLETLETPDDPSGIRNPLSGLVIGNYRLVRLLGSGAMGEVHLAHHRQFSERQYAIKLIRREIATDSARKRFEREIVAMGQLLHPHLVYASDAGIDQDRMYLVMEYVPGNDLQKLIQLRGPFSLPAAAEVLRQMCLGIAHAHERGVVHRDIKPANVLLSDELQVKVLDLGIASLQSEAGSRMTRGGSVMGTAAFIAPELWDDALNATPSSDVYAIGCTAYCLLTGEPPFYGPAYETLVQIMTAHRQTDPTPLHLIRDDVPSEFSLLILRAMHKIADRRFQDAAEFAEQLSVFAEPLSKKVPLQAAAQKKLPTAGTGSRSNSIDYATIDNSLTSLVTDKVALYSLLVSSTLVVFAACSLYLSYFSDFTTETWRLVFGQFGNPLNHPYLGVALDLSKLLIALPAACFILARYYPGEVRRTLDPRLWSWQLTVVRITLVVVSAYFSYCLWLRFGLTNGLPTSLANVAINGGVTTTAILESESTRTYLGYAFVKEVCLPVMTIAFPMIWFLAGDLASLNNRFVRLMVSQQETSFPGRMNENFHRFGIDLCERAGRVFIACMVAAVIFHADYWSVFWLGSQPIQPLINPGIVRGVAWNSVLVALVFATIGFVFQRGFDGTLRRLSLCGTVKDEAEFSKLGLGWFVQKTLLGRLSGVGCLSISLIIGHSIVTAGKIERAPLFGEDSPSEPTSANESQKTSFLPANCKPAQDAELVTLEMRGSQQKYYSEIVLCPDPPLRLAEDRWPNVDSQYDTPDQIRFVLVPQTKPTELPSFYIMKHKVSSLLFEAFEVTYPDKINAAASQKRSEYPPKLGEPVYFVTGSEAIEFASIVCGGFLPRPAQWDTAFGCGYDEAEIKKTIIGSNRFLERMAQNRNRSKEQLAATASDIDYSPWGCMEMGTRGYEYTREDVDRGGLVTDIKNIGKLQLRGWPQREQDPLRLEDWEQNPMSDRIYFGAHDAKIPSDEIGFRVVFE